MKARAALPHIVPSGGIITIVDMSSELSRCGGLGSTGAVRLVRMTCAAVIVIVIAMVIAVAPKAASAFTLGLQDQGLGQPAPAPSMANTDSAMQVMAISSVRISVHWSAVAPDTDAKPSGLRASDPADPHYQWGPVDAAVRAAVAQHKQVLLNLFSAPVWAQGPHRPTSSVILRNAWDPNVKEFAAFAGAAATRYSGTFADASGVRLPRVSHWEIWNEENLPWYLAAPNVVAEYRALVNAAYDAITAVHANNLIVMGGLAPTAFLPRSIAPLRFAAELLCLRRAGTAFHRIPGCQRARFDVFAHHPYSLAATPTKHAYRYDDVLVGDMAKIVTLVQSADRLRTILPRSATGSGSPSSAGTPIRLTGLSATLTRPPPAMSPIPCTRCGAPASTSSPGTHSRTIRSGAATSRLVLDWRRKPGHRRG